MSGKTADAPVASRRAAPSRSRQALPYAVMLVASALLYWAATRIDAYTGGGTRIGPDAWPKAIVVIMGLLCAWEMARRLVSRNAGAHPIAAREDEPAAPVEPAPPSAREHPRRLWGGGALVVAYGVAVSWLGFFVSTALFLGAFPWVGGLRRPALAAALSVVGSFVLFVVFMRVAYISLPLGEGPFRTLSIALLRLIGVGS